jgi:hypothetical protein
MSEILGLGAISPATQMTLPKRNINGQGVLGGMARPAWADLLPLLASAQQSSAQAVDSEAPGAGVAAPQPRRIERI